MCVLSIGFCRKSSCGVNVHRIPSWMHGKPCKSLLSPKSFLILSYLLRYLSLTQSPCALIAEWISGWKHRDACFPIRCRFNSIQVFIVNLLNYRYHMYLLHSSSRSLPVSSPVLVCIFTFELQSESSFCWVCILLSFIQYWFWCWVTAKFVICSAILGFTYYMEFYIIYSLVHSGGKEVIWHTRVYSFLATEMH